MEGRRIEPSDLTRWYSTRVTDKGTIFDLGSITYGQGKDLLIPLPPDVLNNCQFSVVYDNLYKKRQVIRFNVNADNSPAALHRIDQQVFRLQVVHRVRAAFEAMRQQIKNPGAANDAVTAAMAQLKALEEELRTCSAHSDEYISDLLADLTGQVQEAIGREDWFKKWGVHFLPSLTRESA